MESFLANCLDKDLIVRWLVSDDGSSDYDFYAMKRKYPFIEFYRSKKEGQPASLNHLFSKVETEWFFHLEDDWLFCWPDRFIEKLFDIAFDDEKIKNVVLTNWKPLNPGLFKTTKGGVGYVIHKFDPTVSDEDQEATDSGWFGLSLNPGLQNTAVIKSLGKFDESLPATTRLWDKAQAKAYMKMGYKRASLSEGRLYVKHMGGQSLYTIRRCECRDKNRCNKYPDCEGCSGDRSNYHKPEDERKRSFSKSKSQLRTREYRLRRNRNAG